MARAFGIVTSSGTHINVEDFSSIVQSVLFPSLEDIVSLTFLFQI